MRLRHVLGCLTGSLVCAAGCSFDPRGAALLDGGGGPDGGDPPIDAIELDARDVEDVHHVSAGDERLGDTDVTVDGSVTIDTTALTITPAVPGWTVASVTADTGGPDLAIVYARDLTITGTVRAVGERPLVVIGRRIELSGTIDVGARGSTPGAGASTDAQGRGGNGQRNGLYYDGGGGGGGHATAGGDGGNSSNGMGGGASSDVMLAQLVGGSAGGSAQTDCGSERPGAGGGAVQIYAASELILTAAGRINAGGGGGGAGQNCPGQYTAGMGGGSGGSIYLQTPRLTSAGVIAANGGGGGGGASGNSGGRGDDGGASTTAADGGGSGGSPYGASGGRGGADSAPARGGSNNDGWSNGGGGGGAAGRIVVRTRAGAPGTTSPTATAATY